MSDTLEIFGQEWTGVTGFKATDDNDTIKTFIRPQGTISISQNGQGIDVSQYASADVAVPSPSPTIDSLTVTPSTSQQVFNSSSVDGYKPVTVNAMPTMTLPTGAVPTSQASGQRIGTIFPQSVGDRVINIPVGYNDTAKYYNIIPADLMPLTITENGVYDPADPYDVYGFGTVTVNVSGSSKNAQAVTSTTRVTSTFLTACSGTITVAKTGTYDVYWSTHRTSTSGSWSSRLYVNNTASGTEQTSGWSNHVQPIHLTNVSLTAGQTIRVYAKSRGSNYYAYVPLLTIIES